MAFVPDSPDASTSGAGEFVPDKATTTVADRPPTPEELSDIAWNGLPSMRGGPSAKNMALTGGYATAGAVLGTAAFPGPGTVVGAGLGGMLGDVLGQETDKGYNANTPNFGLKPGQVLASGVVSAVPGASLVGRGAIPVLAQGAKFAAANMAANNLRTAIDEGRANTAQENGLAAAMGFLGAGASKAMDSGMGAGSAEIAAAKGKMLGKDSSRLAANEAGYVTLPADFNNGKVTTSLTNAADSRILRHQAIVANTENTAALAAKAIGAPPDHSLGPEVFDYAKQPHNEVYAKVAAVSPEAAQTLDKLRLAREEAVGLYRDSQMPGGYHFKKEAMAADIEAKSLENQLATIAEDASPGLYKQFTDARKALAQIHVVEKATNPETGEVNALDILRQRKNGAPLTDELADIAAFASANPRIAGPASKVLPPNIVKSGTIKTVLSTGLGAMLGGPGGAVAGAVAPSLGHVGRAGARNLLLSDMYQASRFAGPNYGYAQPDFAAQFARFLTMNAGRQSDPNQFLQPQ